MIIVGIDNGEQDRINEYTPWKITESPLPEDIELGGRGAEFAEFIMTVVKPFIDQHYRTKSDKYHTAMIGSSLGGNISAFMGIEYKDQIGCLGIFFHWQIGLQAQLLITILIESLWTMNNVCIFKLARKRVMMLTGS